MCGCVSVCVRDCDGVSVIVRVCFFVCVYCFVISLRVRVRVSFIIVVVGDLSESCFAVYMYDSMCVSYYVCCVCVCVCDFVVLVCGCVCRL